MFSPLAKGNGSWDGNFDDESTFDNLFPSIYQSSNPSNPQLTSDTRGLNTTQEHALHLPKTFLTRKGAILLFAKNGRQNVYVREKPNRNNEKPATDSLVTAEEELPEGEKRKLLLEFLEVFLKDETTNKETGSNPINLKENNWTTKQEKEEDKAGNMFKILSRPKSIYSFHSHEMQAKRQKARPNTAVPVIPNEPEQPKAHPRITSGKPRPPIRALGKLPSKNTRSEFEKEKSNFLRPPSPENHVFTRQLTTPNYSTTNQMVQDEHIGVPRRNSECPRSGKVSRAASSVSRYSAWWATDDISLSYYDNELQDHEDPECIECLSEQRSEVRRMSALDCISDIEGDEGSILPISTMDIENTKDAESTSKPQADNAFSAEEDNSEHFSQNWAAKCDSQPQAADLREQTNASSIKGFADFNSEAIQEVGRGDSYAKQSGIRNRVKSAPCLPQTNDPKFRRKTHSAGLRRTCKPTMFHIEQETVSTTVLEDSSIRVPSAASCHDSENEEDTISVKPSFSQYGTGPGELQENNDIESTNQRLSSTVVTSYPELSLVTSSVEGSGNEIETISNDAFRKPVIKQDLKSTTQDIKSAKEDIKPAKQDLKTTTQNIKSAKEDIKPAKQDSKTTTRDIKSAKEDKNPAKQDLKTTTQDIKSTEENIKPVKQDSRTTIQDNKHGKLNVKPARQDTKPARQDTKPARQDTKPARQDTKPARQDIPLASDVLEPQISEVSPTNAQEHETLNNAVVQEQKIECSTPKSTQNTETDDGQSEKKKDIQCIVLSPEENHSNVGHVMIPQDAEQENNPVKKTEFEENLVFANDDDSTIETKVPNSPEKHHQNNEEVFEITESTKVDGVKSIQTPATDSGRVNLIESLHSNVAKVKQSPNTTVNTNDPNVVVRDIHFLSGKNLKTDELSDKVRFQFCGKGQSFSSDTYNEKDKEAANTEAGIVVQTSNSYDTDAQSGNRFTSDSRDSSKPIKKKEYIDNGLANTKKVDSQSYVPKERKKNDQAQDKSKLDENSKMKEEAKSTKVKTEKTKQEKLDIQGVGKADNMVTDTKDKREIKLQNKTTTGKKAKSAKTARNSVSASKQALEPEPRLELIPTVDENLLQMIENPEGSLELSEETLNQFAPVEDFQDPDLLSVLEDKSNQTLDAFAPSKVKKGRKPGKSGKKKGKVIERNAEEKDAREERKRKMAEAKAKQDEEMKLLKDREEEQTRLLEEAKEKQRIIEEERNKRLAQETEARRQEEAAEQALKEAKRKAKEEREKRREEEAERRRMEVKKKREEKRNRELEIQKREQELEKQRVDREQRMAELQAQKERELELERIAEEERQENETRRLLELEEEKRQEEARIREAEEAVQQMAREREYREQMRRIAEAQQAKLEKQEMERREKEEAERAAIEEERKRLEHEAQLRENEEQKRVRELRQKEAIARIRAAHEASKRRAWALRRRAQNTERMANLRFARQTQKLTEAFTFSYHVHVPKEVWELPYDWNSKKKRGSFRPAKKKQKGKKNQLPKNEKE